MCSKARRAVAALSDKKEDPKISALRLKLEPLDARRQKLALKFAQHTVREGLKKNVKNSRQVVLFWVILSFYKGQKWVKIFTNRSGQARGGDPPPKRSA